MAKIVVTIESGSPAWEALYESVTDDTETLKIRVDSDGSYIAVQVNHGEWSDSLATQDA